MKYDQRKNIRLKDSKVKPGIKYNEAPHLPQCSLEDCPQLMQFREKQLDDKPEDCAEYDKLVTDIIIKHDHVQSIKWGKGDAKTKFGAKKSINVLDGCMFDRFSCNKYNEFCNLIEVEENYRKWFGYYSESIHVDRIYYIPPPP